MAHLAAAISQGLNQAVASEREPQRSRFGFLENAQAQQNEMNYRKSRDAVADSQFEKQFTAQQDATVFRENMMTKQFEANQQSEKRQQMESDRNYKRGVFESNRTIEYNKDRDEANSQLRQTEIDQRMDIFQQRQLFEKQKLAATQEDRRTTREITRQANQSRENCLKQQIELGYAQLQQQGHITVGV